MNTEPRCRKCGCTDQCACTTTEGLPCSWAEPDLCSACVLGAGPALHPADHLALANGRVTLQMSSNYALCLYSFLMMALSRPDVVEQDDLEVIGSFVTSLREQCSLTPNIAAFCEGIWPVRSGEASDS